MGKFRGKAKQMKKRLIALFATLLTAGSLLAEGEMMNVIARGYRVGERGEIVLTTKMADVVDITPTGISSIREGGQPVELKSTYERTAPMDPSLPIGIL